MFEKELKAKLKKIFEMEKVTFEEPADTKEQQALFIDVLTSNVQAREGMASGKVTGTFSIFANSDKMPFGFIAKKIAKANPSDTKDIFFYNVEQNVKYYGNLVERKTGFVYFFSEQYDPEQGEIDSLNDILTID